MDNIILKQNNTNIDIIKEKGINEVIKPLINEIHLFDTFIAGTTHIQNQEIFNEIKIDDELMLVREENKFDEKAIKIITINKKEKLGYVPEKDNLIFSRLLDAGKMLKAKIKEIEKNGSFIQIKIGIYLCDF